MDLSARIHFDSWWAGRTSISATVLGETPQGYRVRFEESAFGGIIRSGKIGFVPKHVVTFSLAPIESEARRCGSQL